MAKAKGKQPTPVVNSPSPTEQNKDKKELLESISKILVFVAALTGILSAAGFYVVHSYLYKVTHLFTYKLDAVVYVAAGVNLIFGIIGKFIEITISYPVHALISGVITSVILIILYVRFHKNTKAIRRINKLGDYFVYISLGLFVILAAFIYGAHGYENSPRLMGGGQPAKVLLLFSQPDKLATMGLPIQTSTAYPAQSQPVELLMELSDGVLVRDPQTQIPVIIKNELLYGMIDAAPPTPAATATPQP